MVFSKKINPEARISYKSASITIQHSPIAEVVLLRNKCPDYSSAFPHSVKVALLDEKGEGAVYNVGE